MTMARKILVIEDEEVIRQLCGRLLEAMGHRLEIVGRLTDGLALIRRDPPDLLITDLRLPDGNGWEAVRELRRIAPGSKIIVVTGSASPEDEGEFSRLEAYIQKPFDIEDLSATVRKVLGEPIR